MNVLTLIHDPNEGPGTLEEYLNAKGITMEPVRLYAQDSIPRGRRGIDGVVSMGGPMNAYDDAGHPFLRDEAAFLSDVVAEHIPVLGICLGAQILARAGGAAVKKAPEGELGWSRVSLTQSGKMDSFFRGLPSALTVFQWHQDTFELPAGAELLACSDACNHQAFRIGSAIGLQFHIEVTVPMLNEWFGQSPNLTHLITSMHEIECDYIRQALCIYRNFVQLMLSSREQLQHVPVQRMIVKETHLLEQAG